MKCVYHEVVTITITTATASVLYLSYLEQLSVVDLKGVVLFHLPCLSTKYSCISNAFTNFNALNAVSLLEICHKVSISK